LPEGRGRIIVSFKPREPETKSIANEALQQAPTPAETNHAESATAASHLSLVASLSLALSRIFS
jgi:hypothetical protein